MLGERTTAELQQLAEIDGLEREGQMCLALGLEKRKGKENKETEEKRRETPKLKEFTFPVSNFKRHTN
jgi:hypothetical protein